jgi:hypothetical protein
MIYVVAIVGGASACALTGALLFRFIAWTLNHAPRKNRRQHD